MSCDNNVCGTGGWGGPKPGDPSNDIHLTAIPAYGGIDINWSFPTTNPFALSYVVVFRGLTDDFNGAFPIRQNSDGYLFDKVEPGTQYFYWIQPVSINGTFGEHIGPASAAAMPSIGQTIIDLTEKIDEGLLAQSLKDKIAGITQLSADFQAEVAARFGANSQLAQAIADLQANVDEVATYVESEVVQRQTADTALVDSMNIIAAKANANAAAITEEATVRASAVSSLASRVTTVESKVGNDMVAVQQQLQANIDKITGAMDAMYTVKVNANDLVGGFGIWNNGKQVQAGFDVNEFWVGTTQANKKKPFIISNGVVYMSEAVIEKLTFDKLRAADGSVIVANGKIKVAYLDADNIVAKQIDVRSGTYGQTPYTVMTNGLTQVYHANGVLAVRMGVW